MRVLITGSTGFVGRRLAKYLDSLGYQLVVTGRSEHPAPLPGTYLRADLSHPEDAKKVCQGIDAIVHCAGKAGAWGPYSEYENANVISTANLLVAAAGAGAKRFINLSSPSIYFDYKDLFNLREDYLPPQFSNAYAKSKYAAEKLVQAAHSSNFWTLSLRPRGVIGAGDTNWFPRIIQMRQANTLVQPGPGTNLADFTSVANLIEIIEKILHMGEDAFGRTYNISNGSPAPLWQVVEQGLRGIGLDSHRKKIPLPVAMSLARMSAIWHHIRGTRVEPPLLPLKVGVAAYSMTLDISLAIEKLGYAPKTTLQDSIEEFANWWTERDQSASPLK